MRLFLAVEIPQKLKNDFFNLGLIFSENNLPIKLVEKEKIHLTLVFLGQTPENEMEKIKEAVSDVAKRHQSFSLAPIGLSGFPTNNAPRVIWIGLKGETGKLISLKKDLTDELKKIKLEFEEERFIPHLTLGRMKAGNYQFQKKAGEILKNVKAEIYPPFLADKITLFESRFVKGGTVYLIIDSFKLLP